MLLKRDDHNTNVAIWQAFLIKQGFTKVVADSFFGPETERATKGFQTSCVIDADGKVGPATIIQAKARGFAGFPTEPPAPKLEPKPVLIDKVVAVPSESNLLLFGGDRIAQINAAKLAKVSPVLQARGLAFIKAAAADGVIVQIVQGLRTFAEQDALYAQGRTKVGKRVTNARGGQSLHNFGLALDFSPVIDGKISWDEKHYRPFGKWAAAAGLEWGGTWSRFKDLPHVQFTADLKLAAIQALYRQGGLAAVWARVQ